MTKNELIWLMIRSAGAYFGYLMIASLFSVIALAPSLMFSAPESKTAQTTNSNTQFQAVQPTPFDGTQIPSQGSEQPKAVNSTNEDDKETSENVKNFLLYLFLTLIYGAIGFYLLKDGRLFYFLLTREDSARAKESEPEVTTLNL